MVTSKMANPRWLISRRHKILCHAISGIKPQKWEIFKTWLSKTSCYGKVKACGHVAVQCYEKSPIVLKLVWEFELVHTTSSLLVPIQEKKRGFGREGSPQRLHTKSRSEAKRMLRCRIFFQPGLFSTSTVGTFGPSSRLGRQDKFPQRWDDTTSQFSAWENKIDTV